MQYEWKQKGADHYEYRADNPENKLYGEVFKEKDVYRGRYLKQGRMMLAPDSYTSLDTAKMVISGMVRNHSVRRV